MEKILLDLSNLDRAFPENFSQEQIAKAKVAQHGTELHFTEVKFLRDGVGGERQRTAVDVVNQCDEKQQRENGVAG